MTATRADRRPRDRGRTATAAPRGAGRRPSRAQQRPHPGHAAPCSSTSCFPLFWLVIAATKTTGDLFSTFGLWFADDFSLFTNIRDTLTFDDGVYARWMLNTLFYSVVSAVGAALLAAFGGYGFAKYRFRGNGAAASGWCSAPIMVPTTALAIPTYLLFAKIGLVNTPWAIILPSLVSPFGLYLMRVYARGRRPGQHPRGRAHRRRREFGIFFRVALRMPDARAS